MKTWDKIWPYLLGFTLACLTIWLMVVVSVVYSHPGGLDKKGCHKVHEDFEYESGKVLKKGTEHCHRGIGAMKLDGKEVLEDFRDDRPVKKEKSK